MKTREQRISEGWVERWGVYCWRDAAWLSYDGIHWTTSRAPGARYKAFCSSDARRKANEGPATANWLVRAIWTRKRPKPAPALQVGDEVLVRATVYGRGAHLDEPVEYSRRPPGTMVDLETNNRVIIRVYPQDIIRVAAPPKEK